MILERNNVSLRPLEITDAELTLNWRQNVKAGCLNRGATTVTSQRAWIKAHTREGEANFIIMHAGLPAGMISLCNINFQRNSAILGRLLIGEVKLVANAPVAFEAELILADYAFNILKLHKLYGEIVAGNIAVIQFRKYIGYKTDGIMRDHFFADGIYTDIHAVSLLVNEYRESCRPRLLGLIDLFYRHRSAGGPPVPSANKSANVRGGFEPEIFEQG